MNESLHTFRKEKQTVWRFAIVGVSNTAVDFAVFFLLTAAGAPAAAAQVVSYGAGMANSYIWNRLWTFQVKRKANIGELLRFLVVNGLSLGVSLGVLLAGELFTPLWLAKMAATIAGMAVNFIGSRYWVFVEKNEK
ncbi:GtrA family protein [Geobacillus sp. Y412MC52]|uniref:GtrA family protein n=1 Tax=Geobacillus sp. (strain Y412MC52) TaxID=550542 RepID=UPI00018C1087|nr:GtrA family protein [Geobacillus sp. Y412MC52]ADU94418.1 GtrA family protein [Geobacillus sp. Y412MC52]ALA71696.1 membrane protein [Geobacillus stearothermophilus 10]